MIFNGVRVRGFRSIEDSGPLPLGPITLVLGRNNAGKSALLRSMYLLQDGGSFRRSDVRVGHVSATVDLDVSDSTLRRLHDDPFDPVPDAGVLHCEFSDDVNLWFSSSKDSEQVTMKRASSREPDNLIHPVLSGRQQGQYEQQVSAEAALAVWPHDGNIVARVKQLSGSDIPEARRFRYLCKEVLNAKFDVLDTEHGQSQRLGVMVTRFDHIPLEAMGTGLSSTLNLLVGLSTAVGKLFLVEEPENDLHPQALKVLVDAIKESSAHNQFIITTHSNVVLTRLGSHEGTVVLYAKSDGQLPPTSSFEVIATPEARLAALRDLGYELADLGLGEGWLVFEESSAERIVRDWLVPWFTPALTRLRTLAAAGVSRVEPVMQDFREMFLFAHLEPSYRGRAWVIVDGDEVGIKAVANLRRTFEGWPADRFQYLTKSDFELYYPDLFADRVRVALSIKDRQAKREAKRELLSDVLKWIEEDQSRAKDAFADSAAEIVDILRRIAQQLDELGVRVD